jgi:hypothetical protein
MAQLMCATHFRLEIDGPAQAAGTTFPAAVKLADQLLCAAPAHYGC